MTKTISASARSRAPIRVTTVPKELRFFCPRPKQHSGMGVPGPEELLMDLPELAASGE
jgi:hypothetical protein